MNWANEEEFTALEVLVEPLPALDSDERIRLRTVLGPAVASAISPAGDTNSIIDLRHEPDPAPLTAEDRIISLSFVLSDIDRKIDKLGETTELMDQLGQQVRRLSERIARIEHLLASAVDSPPPR